MMKQEWQYQKSTERVFALNGEFVFVCNVHGSNDTEIDHRGRLIAAAPDLLEALEALLFFVDSNMPSIESYSESEIILKNAESAIAKAKGGNQ